MDAVLQSTSSGSKIYSLIIYSPPHILGQPGATSSAAPTLAMRSSSCYSSAGDKIHIPPKIYGLLPACSLIWTSPHMCVKCASSWTNKSFSIYVCSNCLFNSRMQERRSPCRHREKGFILPKGSKPFYHEVTTLTSAALCSSHFLIWNYSSDFCIQERYFCETEA